MRRQVLLIVREFSVTEPYLFDENSEMHDLCKLAHDTYANTDSENEFTMELLLALNVYIPYQKETLASAEFNIVNVYMTGYGE